MPIEPNPEEVSKISSYNFNLANNPARYEDPPPAPEPKTKTEPEIVDVTQPVITIEPKKP
jgi:hypothetical protein